jgi:chemotaxis protein MotA
MGVVSLDSDLQTIENPFLRQSLMLAVDGTEPSELRKIMQVSMESDHRKRRTPACGLRVGRRLLPHHRHPRRGARPHPGHAASRQHQEVGRGIAVAFVATIYGVGIANLFFLPFAGKMRIRIREEHQLRAR